MSAWRIPHHFCSMTALLAVGMLTATFAGPAAAQSDGSATTLWVVTKDGVNIRCGGHFRYYSFGQLHGGDLVQVASQKGDWALVRTTGPAFSRLFGYLKYPAAEAPTVRLAGDGKSAMTIGRTHIYAPNFDAKFKPRNSWKPIAELGPDRVLRILETLNSRDERVHKVVLPANAEGWIKMANLRAATPSEMAGFEAGLPADAPTPTIPVSQPPVQTGGDGAVTSSDTPTPGEGILTNPQEVVQAVPPTIVSGRPLPDPVALGNTGGSQAPIEQAVLAADFVGPPVPADLRAARVVRRPVRPVPAQDRAAMIVLKDLDAALDRLLNLPAETIDVTPLQNLYLDFAHQHDGTLGRYARARASQLQVLARR